MQKVIAVRNGRSDIQHLTGDGIEEMRALAVKLKNLIPPGSPTLIVTSPLSRALESARILGEVLRQDVVTCDVLQFAAYRFGNQLKVAIEAQARLYDIVIVVTHGESPSGILNAFKRERGGSAVLRQTIPEGTALIMSLDTGIFNPIP